MAELTNEIIFKYINKDCPPIVEPLLLFYEKLDKFQPLVGPHLIRILFYY